MTSKVLVLITTLLLGGFVGFALAKSSTRNSPVLNSPKNKAVVSTNRLVQGKVVSASENRVIVENFGDRYEVEAFGKFYLNRVNVSQTADESTASSKKTLTTSELKTPVLRSDFKEIKVSDQVVISLEMETEQKYTIKSINIF